MYTFYYMYDNIDIFDNFPRFLDFAALAPIFLFPIRSNQLSATKLDVLLEIPAPTSKILLLSFKNPHFRNILDPHATYRVLTSRNLRIMGSRSKITPPESKRQQKRRIFHDNRSSLDFGMYISYPDVQS